MADLKLNIAFSSTDPAQTIQATLIQQQLQQAGITVTLEGGDGTAIFTELKKPLLFYKDQWFSKITI